MSPEIDVVVALVGDPSDASRYDVLPERFWSVAYSERPKVMLQPSLDETLGELLQRAADELGAQRGAFTAFYCPEHEHGTLDRGSPVLPLIDARGRVTWGHRIDDVRYGDLLRAAETGALNGDPLRPYLILQPSIGNGVVSDWDTVKAIWDTVDYVIAHISNIGGAGAALYTAKRVIIDRLRDRARSVSATMERRGMDWASRNGLPHDLEEWLDNRQWLAAELVPLLDCTQGQAEAVLWAFGFSPEEGGVWRKNRTEEAKFLSATTLLGIRGYTHEASEEELRAIVRDELEYFLEHDQARPFDWERLPWLQSPGSVREKYVRILSPLYHARAWLKRECD